MSILTKERLQQLADENTICKVSWDERIAMARQLLAGMAQEPVAYMHHSGQVVTREECCDDKTFAICCKVETPLYAAPQLPQPAVQNMHHDAKCDLFRPQVVNGVFVPRHCDCSAATLQGAEPISQPLKLRDGWVAVPVEMTPEQMRAVQRDSSLGTFASAHLSGAYDMYREFWDVAIAAAPQQVCKHEFAYGWHSEGRKSGYQCRFCGKLQEANNDN